MTSGTTEKAGRLAFCPTLLLMATAASASQPLPQEVERFVERREVCEHFPGEPWPEGHTREDAERRSFLARELDRHCSGSDAQLGSLRRNYRDDKTILRTLERYEDTIQAK